MEKLTYKLDTFEGPLDLLLYLIQKNKLNICDIPIAELLDQYMEQINAAQKQDMNIASEFLDMAARLVYIKTAYLLPKHEEADTLRTELSGQLLEYQECKRIAALLGGSLSTDTFTREPTEVEPDYLYRWPIDQDKLLAAFYDASGHHSLPPTQKTFSSLVTHHIVSVASQIVFILRRLWHRHCIPYQSLFATKKNKSEAIATFLAVLELVKGKRIRIEGERINPTVKLTEAGERRWKTKH